MASQLVLLTDSFPSDRDPLFTTLDSVVHAVVDGEETDIDAVIFIPKLKAKELAKYLTVKLNRGEKSIDFAGLLVATDVNIDTTTLTVLERLSKVNLRVSSGYESVDGSVLDLDNDAFSADNADLIHWLETKSLPVSAGSEEEVVDQLDDLLADLDIAGDLEDDSSDDSSENDALDIVGGTDRQKDSTSETLVMPVVQVEPEPEETKDDSSDAETEKAKAEEAERLERERQQQQRLEQQRLEQERQREEERKRQERDARIERERVERERQEQEALERKREQERQREEERKRQEEQRQREEEERLANNEADEEDDGDELFDPMADEVEPLNFSQSELFGSSGDDDDKLDTNAYIDAELDNDESDYSTQNARASEPIMTGNIDSPAFLKRKEQEREEARRAAEQLLPDPETFDSDDFELTVEDLEQNDGGFPKDEALSEAQDMSKLTKSESAGEGSPHSELSPHDESDKEEESQCEVLALPDDDDDDEIVENDGREKVGFSAPSLTPRDSFDALKSRRHRETRVGGLTGPSGGSGKTTTAYCLFLGSSVVDSSFSKQRSDQWTWLIEMDYQNPKWKHRTSIPAEKSMVQLVHEFNRRKGTITDDELVELAKRHSVQILGSSYERSRLIAAPELNDYTHSNITRREFMIVANRLINALSRNTVEPSTIILDLPDYSGENLDQNLSDIVNRYCDNVAVCFPEDGDIADLHSIIELLRNQRQHKVSTQRISVIGTRMRTDQEEDLSKACRDMHINFAGRIPLFPSIRRQSKDSESVSERKTWIGNADERTKKNAAMAGTRILQETLLNPMAKMYLREMRKRLQQKNPARKDNENRTRRGSSTAKNSKAKRKKKSGFKSLFGLN